MGKIQKRELEPLQLTPMSLNTQDESGDQTGKDAVDETGDEPEIAADKEPSDDQVQPTAPVTKMQHSEPMKKSRFMSTWSDNFAKFSLGKSSFARDDESSDSEDEKEAAAPIRPKIIGEANGQGAPAATGPSGD